MHTLLATYTTSGLGDLDEGLGRLRLCDPAADQRMEHSLAIHGQLTPLLVRERRDGYAVLDGFKRLRGARALSWSELQIAVIHVNEAQAKLKLVHSNRCGALTAIEEAWVIQALHREDGLSQPEIGRLMGHDKSWVNRRIALAEALSAELQADLRGRARRARRSTDPRRTTATPRRTPRGGPPPGSCRAAGRTSRTAPDCRAGGRRSPSRTRCRWRGQPEFPTGCPRRACRAVRPPGGTPE